MTNDNFIQAVRQYSRLAQRKHRSYAEAVNTLAQARVDAIRATVAGEERQAAEIGKLGAFLMREYGVNDRDFSLGGYS